MTKKDVNFTFKVKSGKLSEKKQNVWDHLHRLLHREERSLNQALHGRAEHFDNLALQERGRILKFHGALLKCQKR